MKDEKIVPALLHWYDCNKRDLPWRKAPGCNDAYIIYVSEVMLQQTQVKTVIPYWERWMKNLPTVQSLANAPIEQVLKLWEGLGYYRRARAMHQAASMVMEKHGGIFPKHFEDVLDLPGIGPYTAGAICSIAYNQPTPIVDGNIIRVIARLQRIQKPVEEPQVKASIWKFSEKLVRAAEALMGLPGVRTCSALNQGLMELGATICTPRQPLCLVCPLQSECQAFQKGDQETYPKKADRIAYTSRNFIAFIFEKKGKYLVRQRADNLVNGGLWEFPNFEILTPGERNELLTKAGLLAEEKPAFTIKHTITRYKITLEVYRAPNLRSLKVLNIRNGMWKGWEKLFKLPFSSAHSKIRNTLA